MPVKLKLCSFKTCPWVHRAAIVLQEKAMPYEIEYIDRDARPDWFLKISPHSKVPVLIIDDEFALFESNAISEYLDEIEGAHLHPQDPILRAQNRAWTDFVPIFGRISHLAYAENEKNLAERCKSVSNNFSKIEDALGKRNNSGPYFNGLNFSLVDAAYAPFLMRFTFFDRIHPLGLIENFSFLTEWRDALLTRPSVIKAVVPDFEEYWRDQLRIRGRWAAKFIPSEVAAE